ncbi:conserved hypothetical protein [Burkholderia cenocepacia HI2424]|uniref:Uncharacterized protein n=1 Tax=Burkholderia orbicola (strain AU 1054) TaxID=331271 RepID=A0A0H2XNB7_BURO1|nr:conserved hypothetical protein [Burkholderia cenocepacia HI2424]
MVTNDARDPRASSFPRWANVTARTIDRASSPASRTDAYAATRCVHVTFPRSSYGYVRKGLRKKFVTVRAVCHRARPLERIGMRGGSGDVGDVQRTRRFDVRRDAADAVSAAREVDCKTTKCVVQAVLSRMTNFIRRVREKK